MDQRRPTEQVINASGQPQQPANVMPNGAPPPQPYRPLQVAEALQYSPMTSAPIFGLEALPRPEIGSPSSLSIALPYSRSVARKLLEGLDHEARRGLGQSARLRAVHKELVQEHLDGAQLSEFKFKLPTGLKRFEPASGPARDKPRLADALTPFAKLMLEEAKVQFRYPEPTALGSSFPSVSSSSSKTSSVSREPHEKLFQHTDVAPSWPPSEYIVVGDQGAAKRRKLDSDGTGFLLDPRLKAQKEEADAALLKLQDLLHEIFEAEDRIEPGLASGAVPQESLAMFRAAHALEVQGPILNSETHSRLQKAIQKVVGFDRLQDIPSEYLTRIQRLCEGPLLSAQTLDLGLEDASNEVQVQTWLQKLEDVHTTFLAIGTLFHTVSGRWSEIDLCPEDLVQAIPNVLNRVFDHCIIPAVEARPTDKDPNFFHLVSREKKLFGNLTHEARKLLGLLATFLSHIEVSEEIITATEFMATKLIFVENAHNDRESAIGFQKYEAVRRGAMDVIAKIFSKYQSQRSFILDEILVSLEKLPSTRQNARQFKLSDGKSIQLLTALVMQLVQTTALDTPTSGKSKTKPRVPVPREEDDDELALIGGENVMSDTEDDILASRPSLERLARHVDRLYDNAVRNAQYIVKFIVQRAMTSTKTGDQPFRNILDLFTEDLLSVLGSTDWPAAELLLRIMASHMVGIAELDKSPANAKNMALELLGWMGSGISDLTATAQHLASGMDDTDAQLTDLLRQVFDDHIRHALNLEALIAPDGPYRIALEYLQDRYPDNWQLTNARGYYIVQWAKTVVTAYNNSPGANGETSYEGLNELLATLPHLILDPKWLETNSRFKNITTVHGKLAYILTVLNMGFCKAFDTIFKVLLNSITSDQAKLRSRSLKSVIAMLEKDPSLLDRDATIIRVILNCVTDASPMVRDSALSLISKCIALKPAYEEDGCRAILVCAADPTVGVRKRCITLLRDIYSRTSRRDLKLAILDSLLQRTGDYDQNVSAQARQTFEEILLTPFHISVDTQHSDPKATVALSEQVALIVNLVQRSETAVDGLTGFLRQVIPDVKQPTPNFKVCKAMVAIMFERIVDDSSPTEKLDRQALLQTITVFAKGNAKLFSPEQLEALHPYIGNLVTADDLLLFRFVVIIYRCVLPHVSSAYNTLLKSVQNDLFKSVAKLARAELNEVMACLWTINGVLQNTDRLVKLTISVLKGINQAKGIDLSDSSKTDALGRSRSYIRIAGCVGRHCDLEKFESHFKAAFPSWKGGSVAGLLVDTILPFAQGNQPLELRSMALESIGSICQSWPAQFSREGPRQLISAVFKEDNASLHNIILRSFSEFFAIHEGKLERLVQPAADSTDAELTTRFGGSMKASDHDGAAALIAQHFLQDILRVARSRQDAYTLTAIELIASINRQGLVHPKECAGVLVSLETSTVPAIARIAYDTHKMLHLQYESMFEREYMRAISEAFVYQRDVVGDSSGATARPYTAKLAPLFDIVKLSNSKYQKKFLSNLCAKVNFELKDLDVSGNPPEHMLLARFVSHNLAFFEYAQIAELLPTIACMERIVSSTGSMVAHAIEREVFCSKLPLDAANDSGQVPPPMAGNTDISHAVDPRLLRQLATAAAILSMLWEARSHLRRQYGINAQYQGKLSAKDLNRPATKVQGITGDRFWEAISRNMTCLDSDASMREKCREFTNLLSIDEEFKIPEEDDLVLDAPDDVPEDDATSADGSKPLKRKQSQTGSQNAKRPRGRNLLSGGRRRSSSEPDELSLN